MDIKISLEIGLSPALEGFLTKVLGDGRERGQVVTHGTHTAGHNDDAERAALQEARDAETDRVQSMHDHSPQPEAQRRTRRTKAQMAEDAAATNSGSTGKTDDGAANAEATATEIAEAGRATDLAAALGVEQPEAREGVTAKADVAAKMQEAMAAASPKKVQEKMIEHLNGAKNLSGLDPALYGKAVELFDSIIAGA